jgi:hypothetical protein
MLLNQNPDIQQSIGKLELHPQITIKNLEKTVHTKVTTTVASIKDDMIVMKR